MFHVGQKVVCVDDTPAANMWHRENPLVLGKIYQIKDMSDDGYVCVDETPRLWLRKRFRPIVDRKTDISIFTAMLNAAKTPERV